MNLLEDAFLSQKKKTVEFIGRRPKEDGDNER